ncbi:HEAT repeat-containing protein 6 [Drosophila busckii]|uniref:HEAT repeat-containing protein 6 n=1 Tax=Drosophila busckii TaxID=30019 RepID=UPI00083ED200|nr:HEAT repeat-containing protein 6 [Drosophila busckii]
MEKVGRAYEALIYNINERARNANPAQQAHYQRQLQFLRSVESQTVARPYGVKLAAQLAQLLDEEVQQSNVSTDEPLNLNAWLTWLNELLLSRKLENAQPLLEWMLRSVAEKQTPDTLCCLLSLLKPLTASQARMCWAQLAPIKPPGTVETALLLVLCQETVFAALCLGETPLEKHEMELSAQLATALLDSHYEGCWARMQTPTALEEEQLTLLLTHTLQLLQQIAAHHEELALEQAPELLGLALANLRFGAGVEVGTATIKPQLPHRVQPAQQSAAYDQEEEGNASTQNTATTGRRVKSRKMRSLAKHRANNNNSSNSNTSNNNMPDNSHSVAGPAGGDRLLQLLLHNSDYGSKTPSGDSDCSATAQLVGQKQQRQCQVKVRMAALQLLGVVTKQLPRRQLYGYWHALFPSVSGVTTVPAGGCEAKDQLLFIGLSDTNVRCRALALQLAAQLLYGSRTYLGQASSAVAPSNYTPFSVSLASSVLEAYRLLTAILVREYATPVLTQCLRCLAVLVQATPFEQLEMGFVYEFVPLVKKLAGHADTNVKVSALLVMEMLVATPRLTQEIACAIGLPLNERGRSVAKVRNAVQQQAMEQQVLEQQFEQLCHSDDEEEEVEVEADEQQEQEEQEAHQDTEQSACWPRIPRNSWLLRLVLRYLDCPSSPAPLRIECLQVLLAMATHFALLREHLTRLATLLSAAFEDASLDVRLYAARCLDALGYQLARQELQPATQQQQQQQLNFWLRMLPSIYAAYTGAATATLKCALCDALANIGASNFERLPQPQRNGLLAFLCGCSSDDAAERLVRAAALRALAVYVMLPTLRGDLVFVEHAAELALRLSADQQLAVRIKAAWALGNISDALVAPSQQQEERISQSLLTQLIEAAIAGCCDHDKVRANAVRSLGNLLRLLPGEQQALLQRGMSKLLDCVRAAGSAKVKWNACYAIGNLVRNRALFAASAGSASTLFTALSQLIVQHANFKVRINATAVLLQIEQRADFGTHFAAVWRSLMAAVERSNALDTFEEYNHRDGLQQQLCLAMAHLLERVRPDDLCACGSALEAHLDVVSSTWRRVAYRIVPEQATPLFTCSLLLQQRLSGGTLNSEQRNALTFLASTLRLES